MLKNVYLKKIFLSSSNTIISDFGHGSQWVCMATGVSIRDLSSGWNLWPYEVQWLSASMPGVKDSLLNVGTLVLRGRGWRWRGGRPVDLGALCNNPLPF